MSWKASPSAAAAGSAAARGPTVPSTGTICKPIAAAEPCMYSRSSAMSA
ncbi:Uncharacterised protein [Mycobacteroides abscessus subsp. abscessus]|nr:Uncharacterised protein [Mycobacteroides abscessus subsp. abscessus]